MPFKSSTNRGLAATALLFSALVAASAERARAVWKVLTTASVKVAVSKQPAEEWRQQIPYLKWAPIYIHIYII